MTTESTHGRPSGCFCSPTTQKRAYPISVCNETHGMFDVLLKSPLTLFHPCTDFEPPIELDDVQKEVYDEEQLGRFLAGAHADNHFGYIIDVFEKCRAKFNHKPHARRTERDERFRAASENLLRQARGPPLASQRQDTWPSAPMVAPQPTLPHSVEAFPQALESRSLGYHDHVNEPQMRRHEAGVVGGISTMPGQGQRTAHLHQHGSQTHSSLLRPQLSAHVFRAQNCSSRTSMRSGASSNTYFDIDAFPTPGTSHDGHVDATTSGASSARSSSLYLAPPAEPGKTGVGGGGPPSLEPPETNVPDNIGGTRAPAELSLLSRPKQLSYCEPPVVHSVTCNGRVVQNCISPLHQGGTTTTLPNFADEATGLYHDGSQELQDTITAVSSGGGGGSCWPGAYYPYLDLPYFPAGIERPPEVPENWPFSQDAATSHLKYNNNM